MRKAIVWSVLAKGVCLVLVYLLFPAGRVAAQSSSGAQTESSPRYTPDGAVITDRFVMLRGGQEFACPIAIATYDGHVYCINGEGNLKYAGNFQSERERATKK